MARYRCVLVLVRSASDPTPLVASGVWEGRIATHPSGDGGFGYDPLFIPAGYSVTSAQLSAQLKNSLSHRAAALRQLLLGCRLSWQTISWRTTDERRTRRCRR